MSENTADMKADVTVEELQAANVMAKKFYETLGGTNVRHVVMAMGLLLRCVAEEQMTDPNDEEERESRLHTLLTLVIETIDHPAVMRKGKLQ